MAKRRILTIIILGAVLHARSSSSSSIQGFVVVVPSMSTPTRMLRNDGGCAPPPRRRCRRLASNNPNIHDDNRAVPTIINPITHRRIQLGGPKYTKLMKEGGWVQHQGTFQRIDLQMLARYQQESSSSVRDDITIPGFQEYSNTDDTVYYSTPQVVAAAVQGGVSSSNNEEATTTATVLPVTMEEQTRKQIEENILFVNKPSQLNCVPSRTSTESLATQLRGVHPAAKPCHRLDRDTSGLVVFGLTKAAHRTISMQFEARTTSKTYLALLSGRPPHDQGTVTLPIGKQATAAGYHRWTIGGDQPRAAITQWTVETVSTDPDTGAVITRIRLTPRTGRGHQLRLHMHALGCPILGDTLHGTGGVAMCSPRLCLHAQQLCVDWNGIRLVADSVPPF